MLGALGHQVDVAANGIEAVEAVRALPYDLVFMDMQMPEMDGLDAAREIRGLEAERGQVPIVAMTANAMEEHKERCLDAGMTDYLSKPITRDRLAVLIENVLGSQQE